MVEKICLSSDERLFRISRYLARKWNEARYPGDKSSEEIGADNEVSDESEQDK